MNFKAVMAAARARQEGWTEVKIKSGNIVRGKPPGANYLTRYWPIQKSPKKQG